MTKKKLIIIVSAFLLIIIICVSVMLLIPPKDLLINQFDLVDKYIKSISMTTARNGITRYRLEGELLDKYRTAVNNLRVRELTKAEENQYINNSIYNQNMLSIIFKDGIFIQIYILQNYSESKYIKVLYSVKGDDWKYYRVLNNSIITFDNIEAIMDTADTNPDVEISR